MPATAPLLRSSLVLLRSSLVLRTSLAVAALFLLTLPAPGETCLIDEDFRNGSTRGSRPAGQGKFTSDGWLVTSPTDQILWDLGGFYPEARVELVLRGPLKQERKHSLLSAWNEEAGADGDRKTQSFFQMRLFRNGMMLRLSNRSGGRSFEGLNAPLEWEDTWYTMRGEWNSSGGENRLWRNGELLKAGRFNAAFPGLRWVFVGKDNYQKFQAIPGTVYQRVRVCIPDKQAN